MRPGTRLGPYTIDAAVGQGGLGVVYRALGPDGAVVAVKVLKRTDGDTLARFERERRLQSSLGLEAGFVPLVDAGETEGTPWVVMPFLMGGTLRERLQRGPVPLADAIAFGRRLAGALGEAHARGIVHRDVKPENILFASPSSPPLLADLGLAKHFDRSVPGAAETVLLSMPGGFKGTPGYMAPEQMIDARAAAPPADVYALGVVLYECVAGTRPFDGHTFAELLRRVDLGDHVPVSEANPEVPRWFAAVIERALAREAAVRFPDGHAFARALDAGLARSESRSRALVAVLVGLWLILGVLVFVGARRIAAARRDEETAPAPLPLPR